MSGWARWARRGAAQVGSPVGWVRLPAGRSRRLSPLLSRPEGAEEGNPIASPTRQPRGAEGGKKRRRSLRSG